MRRFYGVTNCRVSASLIHPPASPLLSFHIAILSIYFRGGKTKTMQLSKVIIRNTLVVITLCLIGGVVANAQTDPDAEEWARTQMTSTVAGGTGLFNTFSPRVLRRGELTFGLFYNNVKRDPGALDINTIPANLTFGLGGRFE